MSAARNSLVKTIRSHKRDSAFVYCILESHEGTVSYSTLPHQQGDAHRDVELRYTAGAEEDLGRILNALGTIVYELSDHSKGT